MDQLKRHATSFLADAKARGLSPKTLIYYQGTLDRFLEFCETEGVVSLDGITLSLLRAYLASCHETLSPGGVHARLRGVRTFVGYLLDAELIEHNPFKRFKMPKVPDGDLDVVQPDEFLVLMGAAASGELPLRDQAILSLLYDTGLRASELCSLRVCDVSRGDGGVLVSGKGGKLRLVPVSALALKRINKYILRERPKSDEETLFLTEAKVPMGYGALRLMLERTYKRAGRKTKLPHAFRRGFAADYSSKLGKGLRA